MSLQITHSYSLVVCNLCGQRGPAFHQDWRQMRVDDGGRPIHLCRACRQVGMWCNTHQCYHRPHDLHRCACVECGGLFTEQFRRRIMRCPSCQRQNAPQPAELPVVTQQAPAKAGLFGRVRAFLSR